MLYSEKKLFLITIFILCFNHFFWAQISQIEPIMVKDLGVNRLTIDATNTKYFFASPYNTYNGEICLFRWNDDNKNYSKIGNVKAQRTFGFTISDDDKYLVVSLARGNKFYLSTWEIEKNNSLKKIHEIECSETAKPHFISKDNLVWTVNKHYKKKSELYFYSWNNGYLKKLNSLHVKQAQHLFRIEYTRNWIASSYERFIPTLNKNIVKKNSLPLVLSKEEKKDAVVGNDFIKHQYSLKIKEYGIKIGLSANKFIWFIAPSEDFFVIDDNGKTCLYILGSQEKKIKYQLYKEIEVWKEKVQKEMEIWQQKGEFEPTKDYKKRMSQRDERIKDYKRQAADFQKQTSLQIYEKTLNDFKSKIDFTNIKIIGNYDADNEIFDISVDNIFSFKLKVPLYQAKEFKEQKERLRINDSELLLSNGFWELSKISFVNEYFPGNKNYFEYDASKESDYKEPEEIKLVFEPINIQLNDLAIKQKENEVKTDRLDEEYNIERNIPKTKNVNNEAFAVIFGNKNYDKLPSVKYAKNDATSIKTYLINSLGYKSANIFVVEDATYGDFKSHFGEKGKLATKMNKNRELFIFISGHGAPAINENDGKAYFVCKESDMPYLQANGYSFDKFLENLVKIPAKKKTIVLDVCFSGGELLKDEKISSGIGITINPKNAPNTAIFTSSKGNEVSTWFEDKQHGLFTYLFLKGIHNSNADVNNDKTITYQELFNYVSNETSGLPYYARYLEEIEQHPDLMGGIDMNSIFVDLR